AVGAPHDVVAVTAAALGAPHDVVACIAEGFGRAPHDVRRPGIGSGPDEAALQPVIAPDDLLAPDLLHRHAVAGLLCRVVASEAVPVPGAARSGLASKSMNVGPDEL